MQNNIITRLIKFIIIFILAILCIIVPITMFLMLFGSYLPMGNACWFRYAQDDKGVLTSTVLSKSQDFKLNANGNYTIKLKDNLETGKTESSFDETRYGEWQDVGTISDEPTQITVEGKVSLCKSYVPKYDAQNNRGDYPSERAFEIPRVGSGKYFSYYADAKSDGKWRNLVEHYIGDEVRVFVSPPATEINSANLSDIVLKDSFNNNNRKSVDCKKGNTGKINPECGRFTYLKGQYLKKCVPYDTYSCNNKTCTVAEGFFANLDLGDKVICSSKLDSQNKCKLYNPCKHKNFGSDYNLTWSADCDFNKGYTDIRNAVVKFKDSYGTMPFIFEDRTIFGFKEKSSDFPVSSQFVNDYDCSSIPENDTISADKYNADLKEEQDKWDFWLTEGNGLGLKFSSNLGVPSTYTNDELTFQQSKNYSEDSNAPGKYIPIPGGGYTTPIQMLQVGFLYDNQKNNDSDNNGGYILSVQHTKCVRRDGKFMSDTFEGRGAIQYHLIPQQCNLNDIMAKKSCSDGGMPMCRSDALDNASEFCKNLDLESLPHGVFDFNNNKNIDISVNKADVLKFGELKLWLKINNNTIDYKESSGAYDVKIAEKEKIGVFTYKVLQPIFDKVDRIIENAGQKTFKNLTCYKSSDSSRCTDFFMYIRSILTLYIIFHAAMFLLGKSKFEKYELLTHVIKILIISGLINGTTFEFFNQRIFPALMGFTDEIISNFGGYSAANPFAFLDDSFNRILLNKLTMFQIFSLISNGIAGIVFLIITIIGVVLFLITGIQAITTYIFAKLLVAFLLGLAPLFLTFMLFDVTRSFFQNWINTILRYTIEPVVMIIGLTIFSKLFIFYFDQVFGFSVCFKCAIPFRIPNLLTMFIPGMPEDLKNVYVFCLYWFGPWGVDSRSGLISLPIPEIVGLFFVSYMCFTYATMAGQIVGSLMNSMAPSSSEMGGSAGIAFLKPIQRGGQYIAGKIAKRLKLDAKRLLPGNVNKNIPDGSKQSGAIKDSVEAKNVKDRDLDEPHDDQDSVTQRDSMAIESDKDDDTISRKDSDRSSKRGSKK